MISKNKQYYFLPDEKKIGEKIREIRKKSKKNVGEFAESIGVTDISFYKWQRGECFPDIETLKKIINLSKEKLTLDDILIPDANLRFDIHKYPQFLKLIFKYKIDSDGKRVITNLSEIMYNIDSYKEHCEIVNYLNQREVFSFSGNLDYYLAEKNDDIIKMIQEKYGKSYRFNKEERNSIYNFYEKERLKNFFNSFFNMYALKLLIAVHYYYEDDQNVVYDNSVIDVIFAYSRLCEYNNLEYQIKIFNLLDDYYKNVVYLQLLLLDNELINPMLDYLKKDEMFFLISCLVENDKTSYIDEIELLRKSIDQGFVDLVKNIHKTYGYNFKEDQLIEESIYIKLIILSSMTD